MKGVRGNVNVIGSVLLAIRPGRLDKVVDGANAEDMGWRLDETAINVEIVVAVNLRPMQLRSTDEEVNDIASIERKAGTHDVPEKFIHR